MIRGLDQFREHFAQHRDAYALIGGVACHEWLAEQGLPFRATKDLDIVLVIEALDNAFAHDFWAFIDAGGYEVREKDGKRELYRFSRPADDSFPVMLEIFSRQPENILLSEGQTIVPIDATEDAVSLSAILLDEAYYKLIVDHRVQDADPPYIAPAALIPLKARAWLDLTKRKEDGQRVDSKDIDKHRSDVFRLAATLPGQSGPPVEAAVAADLKAFLSAFPPESPEWKNILASLKTTFGNTALQPEQLVQGLSVYFNLA